ncbi:hypothetical protein EHW97_00430 [Aeromicrobium camelliae]|uniref:Secreted protein n=1 Tax=Aeromicrobium camelliae TaxID=1538144 RepID=A0A3N6WRS8_9ACTN|nr:hypothetical protein [Aeromicrobium camelliae]RQN10000.1 hypothetical protein EHW97_00430 [Aeromicrobium camelliae]
MTVLTQHTKKRAMAALGATAMTAALVAASVTPASAADYQLGPEDIIGFEDPNEGTPGYNYDQWHIGNTEDPAAEVSDSLQFNECSVTTLAAVERDVTQVLKGFAIDQRPTAGPEGNADELRALIESISIDVEQGDVTLQLPFFVYPDGDPEGEPGFTTVRNAQPFGPGQHTFQGVELTASNGGTVESMDVLLEELETSLEELGGMYQILGVGFTGSEGAVINSISFAGDTYYFGTGDCIPAPPVQPQPQPQPPAQGEGPQTPTAPRPPVAVHTGR